MRLTRRIQKEEMDMYNPTRPANDKFVETDYACKRSAYDRDILNKLGQLEDIEDGFGCDFIFLNEICKNGVYCYKRSIKDFNANGKRLGKIIHIPNFDIHVQFFGCYKKKKMGVSIMGCIDYVYHSLPLNEYGITWALTKEELTNEKEN